MKTLSQIIKENNKEFKKRFNNPRRKKTYIGDLLQYRDKNGDIVFTIYDVKYFLEEVQIKILEHIVEDLDNKNWNFNCDCNMCWSRKKVIEEIVDPIKSALKEIK